MSYRELLRRFGDRVLIDGALDALRTLPDDFFHVVVTSPPYYGLRDYGTRIWFGGDNPDYEHGEIKDSGFCVQCDAWLGQLGLEPTPEMFIGHLVEIFREVRRVLRPDGTFFLNIGDSYDKEKSLRGIPWRLALALRGEGWTLRQEIVWCLSGGAWVYARTQKGDMPMMIKDLVRLDPSTVRLWNGLKWTRVLGWGQSTNDSERSELVLRSGERIGCTGGHPWPTQRGIVLTRDLRNGDEIALCSLPDPEESTRPAYLTDDALWLIGLYLAEGSQAGDTIQLSLHADEQRWLPRLESVATHYGGTCAHTLDGNSLSVRMWGRILNAILNNYVSMGDAHTKHLKVAAWALPSSSLRHIANGYLEGDGSAEAGRIRLGFCRNYALERDLRTLAARLGAVLTLRPTFSKGFGRKFPSFKGEWRWTRSEHRNEKSRGEIIAIRSSRARQFWDLAVEDEPHLFALASGVLTHNCKPNVMPESVRDRPTRSHEQVFLLTKSAHYFYDDMAEREPCIGTDPRYQDGAEISPRSLTESFRSARLGSPVSGLDRKPSASRNLRSVWKINPQPYKGAHFAVFPPALPRRCIRLGSSEHGACSECGAPYERILERVIPEAPRFDSNVVPNNTPHQKFSWDQQKIRDENPPITKGWEPTCKCTGADVEPCITLDPFSGSGTTLAVSVEEGRRYVGIELNKSYKPLIDGRLRGPTEDANERGLFSLMEHLDEDFGDDA